MSLRIGFFQYELSHPGNAPHVGMCLLLQDLRDAGHEVDAALVHVAAVDRLISQIHDRAYDVVALDAIFTRPVVERLKRECPEVTFVVGGNNALGLALTAPIDHAVVGPGRRAFARYVDALTRGASLDEVPNLFRRHADGTLDHTGVTLDWALDAELDPFDPDLDWGYLGPERSPQANTRFPSVVPEWGCAFQADSLEGDAYRELPRNLPSAFLDRLALTDRARDAIDPYLANTRGCAFCAFRFQPYTIDRADLAAERAVRQMRALSRRYGVRSFSVQSENPFRFLDPLVDRLAVADFDLDAILLRTFPAILARSPERVLGGIARAVDRGIAVQLQQLGFESFSASELDHLGKGITVDENVAAARLLYELDRRHGTAVEVFSGHGFILFTPWTTPEDVAASIQVIETEAPFLRGAISLASRLCFYDPLNPIFRLAEREGLVVETEQDYGLDFRYADPRTTLLAKLTLAVEGHLSRTGAPRGPALSRAALTATTPLFVDRAGDPPDVLYHAAVKAAGDLLARDGEVWAARHRRARERR